MSDASAYDSSMDPELLKDFVTEASELLDQVDQDLVTLESSPADIDLLNNVFRAMHTIKGSGSFLGLTELCDFTHAAEDALNVLRKGQAELDAGTMDVLLAAVDVIKRQTNHIAEGTQPEPGPEDLVSSLRAVGGGGGNQASSQDNAEPSGQERTLALSDSKLELLPFMIDDLMASLDELAESFQAAADGNQADDAGCEVAVGIAEELIRSVEFFEQQSLVEEMSSLREAAAKLAEVGESDQVYLRIAGVMQVMRQRAEALRERTVHIADTSVLRERLAKLLAGEDLEADEKLPDACDVQHVVALEVILPQTADSSSDPAVGAAAQPDAGGVAEGEQGGEAVGAGREQAPDGGKPRDTKAAAAQGEQTIRVDVARLEGLLNLMGELVLQKNRVLGVAKRASGESLDGELREEFEQIASDLDRVTAELQMGVMKARMQPMHKLFSRYPRVIRDLARMTGKEIDLQVEGAETEVDKSVVEALGDPLVHILRNSADHGIEAPEVRESAGKPRTGTISLSARHDGNHVVVIIRDDGKGIDPAVISEKALAKGLVSQADLDDMSESQILQLLFAPGFSTAEKVSDLSGRGVGMDVVRTNITRLNGAVELTSVPGHGSCVTIRIPLTLAIMPAMMVKIQRDLFALPLSSIHEIVRPSADELYTVRGQQVMRLRDEVVPLIDLREQFKDIRAAHSQDEKVPASGAPFAVIAASGDRKAGLLVDGLIGQQEVVIKPLDELFDRNLAVSGATVREDGGVSLIVDIGQMLSVLKDVA